jgi:uncharacterized protein YjiS (DUF1127 family)
MGIKVSHTPHKINSFYLLRALADKSDIRITHQETTSMSDLMMTRFEQARPSAGRAGWAHVVDALKLMFRTYKTRRALLEMTPRELSDIGISRATAIAEASRLPWDMAPVRHQR